MKIIELTSVTILILSMGNLQAQQAPSSAGGDATGTGGSSSYTVGQSVCTTAAGTGGSSSQGVQQAYKIDVISSVYFTDILLEMNAYPQHYYK